MCNTSIRSLCRGFTLVELLVVIGIIALLISILLPSLNKARDSAVTVTCASNMRQISLAYMQYAIENRNWIAPGYGPGPDPVTGAPSAIFWHARLAPVGPNSPNKYLPWSQDYWGRGVWLCPAENREIQDQHYAANVWITGYDYIGTPYLPHKFSDLKASQDLVVLATEANEFNVTSGYGLPAQNPPAFSFRHNRNTAINMLYADGVVRSHRYTDVFEHDVYGPGPNTVEVRDMLLKGLPGF